MKKRVWAVLVAILLVGVAVQAGEIHDAAEKGDLAKVKGLLAKDPKLANEKDQAGNFPLYYAAALGHQAVVELLIAQGADLKARNGEGVTALHGAADSGRKEVCELLLAKGADINVQDNDGATALGFATIADKIEIVRLLVAKGADVNLGFKPGEDLTPMLFAASRNDLELAKLLLDQGANVNAKYRHGFTALHFAASWLNVELVKLLVEKGADVNARLEGDYTPMDNIGAEAASRQPALNAKQKADQNEIIAILKAKGATDDPAKRARFVAGVLRVEVKSNLDAIATAEIGFNALHEKYGLTFKEIEWMPEGESRYAYFLAQDVIQPKLGGSYKLPQGIKSEIMAQGFTIIAVTNLDDDPTLDVWAINEKKELKNLSDDVEK
jgi:ankyrin repeat protein